MMNKRDRRHLFNRWADSYDESVVASKDAFPFAGYEQVLDDIVGQADVKPGVTILELGIGTGNLAQRFIYRGAKVLGIDFSSAMIAQAKRKLPQAECLQANLLHKWPKEMNRRFDRIVSAYVFHEFDQPTKRRLLKRLANHHLSAHGFIVIGDIAFTTRRNYNHARKKWNAEWDETEQYWVANETIHVFKKIGLRVIYKQVSICGGVFTLKPMSIG